MLHKRFKPSKCKTSLKLATSRIKLMRNKKGVQINQMKKELAQLLETGQDRTARIRVEHVIREEKMVAAYNLVEIYCELIVARMAIIESQKTCPIDLKEAITSVIFAAPRCSDISELSDIKKQFTAKYGKEFVSTALELRPESGVSRMVVEKLSAVPPDIQTKVKVLSEVAKEYNINWEPTSFEENESKPQNDLLNGPTNFENASMANSNPSKIQVIQPSNINDVHIHENKRDPPFDFAEQNRKYVVDNDIGTSSSGINSERMEMSNQGQNWNMGFKDATSAAEAAAESAERAAIAARAAARFASHEKISDGDETPRVSRVSYEQSFSDEKQKIINQKMDRKDKEKVHETNTISTKLDSFKESKLEIGKKESFSGDQNLKIINQQFDRNEHERKNTERFHEDNSRFSNSSSFMESRNELESGKKEEFESENNNLFSEEMFKKQPSVHSVTTSDEDEDDDEVVFDELKAGKRVVVGNPFAVVDERNLFSESRKSKSDFVDQRDDEVVSDDDDDGGPKFDTGFDYDEVEVEDNHVVENAHIWSPRKNESFKIEETSSRSNVFSESVSFGKDSVKSTERSEVEDRVPLSFDHSDSESESGNKKSTSNLHDVFATNPEPSRKSRIELNDLVDSVEVESSFDEEKKQPSRQSSSVLLEKHHEFDQKSYDTFEDNDDFLNRLNDSDSGSELKFGTLTGGLRNKGGVRKYPPYTKTVPKMDVSKSIKSSEETSLDKNEDKKISVIVSVLSSESDSDDYSEKFPVHSSNTRSRFSPPVTFFDDDEEKEVVKKVPSSNVRLRTELSRRTRGSPSVSTSKSRVDREPKMVNSGIHEDKNPNWKSHSFERKKTVDHSEETERKVPMRGPTSRNSDELGKKKIVGKTETLGSEKVGVENVVKKPSYVHPKLPDYDTFAARLQSLRNEHK